MEQYQCDGRRFLFRPLCCSKAIRAVKSSCLQQGSCRIAYIHTQHQPYAQLPTVCPLLYFAGQLSAAPNVLEGCADSVGTCYNGNRSLPGSKTSGSSVSLCRAAVCNIRLSPSDFNGGMQTLPAAVMAESCSQQLTAVTTQCPGRPSVCCSSAD